MDKDKKARRDIPGNGQKARETSGSPGRRSACARSSHRRDEDPRDRFVARNDASVSPGSG